MACGTLKTLGLWHVISQKHTKKLGVWHVACGTENVRSVWGQVQSGVGDRTRLTKGSQPDGLWLFDGVRCHVWQVQSGVGDSERLLASLFRKAAAAAPCVLFLDELQAPPCTLFVSALFFWEIILLDRFWTKMAPRRPS